MRNLGAGSRIGLQVPRSVGTSPDIAARPRLGWVAAAIVACAALLGARLLQLSSLDAGDNLRKAEQRMGRSFLVPTVRGSILDRKGRVLAQDVASWDVGLDYRFIDGTWVRERAERDARKALGRSLWAKLPKDARDSAVEARSDAWRQRRDELLDAVAGQVGLTRGELLTEMEAIRDRVERRAEATWERQRAQLAARSESAARSFVPEPIEEQRMSHVVAAGVPDAVAFELRKLGDQWPGSVEVIDGMRREYPERGTDVMLDLSTLPLPLRRTGLRTVHVDGALDGLVGAVRNEVWATDVARRPFSDKEKGIDRGGYGPTPDAIGKSGLEAAYEDRLRGQRGFVREGVDGTRDQSDEPVRGRDLHLTIDAALQARVQALLDPALGLTRVQSWQHGGNFPLPDGTPLASAAVVIEVESGDVLAMASWPTAADAERLTPEERSRLMPGLDRAAEAVYPPGSIVKPLVYAGAVATGKITSETAVPCNGHFFPEFKDRARCWIWRPEHGMATHSSILGGPLPVEAAISRSCNIYFFTVAQRMGLRGIVDWYRRLGLGQTLGTGLQGPLPRGQREAGGESAGILPDEEELARIEARRDAFTPIILGIGQGPMAWTPLQAANAFATLARGGELRDARVVSDDDALPPDRRRGTLAIPEQARRRAMEGLRQAVEESHGTGHHVKYDDGRSEVIFDVPGVKVMGKTGTAQAPPLAWDRDGDGTRETVVRALDHSWFVGLVGERGRATPRYAVAVIVEYGGSGGKTAGPLAEQVMRALADEGYLDDGSVEKPAKPRKGRSGYQPRDDDGPSHDGEPNEG